MSETSDQQDWAKLRLEQFEAVGNMQLKGIAAQADYALKMQQAIAQQIQNERDITRLKILKDALRDYKRQRQEGLQKVNIITLRVKKIEMQANWLRKAALGQHLPQNTVVYVWSAFYYFLQQISPIDLPPPQEAYAARNFTRDITVPETENTAWGYLLFLRSKNTLPRTSTPAAAYLYQIVTAMCETAETLAAEEAAKAQAAETRVQQWQEKDWQQVFNPTA